jgi:putative DNA primase/helicase
MTASNRTLSTFGVAVNVNGTTEQRVPCPRCAKTNRDDALGVNIQTGMFHCFRCGWKGRAAGADSDMTATLIARINDPAVAARKRERLRQTWKESVPLAHPKAHAVRTYLQSRALNDVLKRPPTVLRGHPGLTYWDGVNNLGTYPAMVALFQGAAGQPVTLHVTYLRSDGGAKASVPSPKKILGVPVHGATRGGAIHLYEPRDGKLGISEGIESALSLHLLQIVPVWASFCADNLARVHLPRNLRELHIGVDIDETGKGEQVARDLANRAMQWSRRTKVYYVKPELKGPGDLNDELRQRRSS